MRRYGIDSTVLVANRIEALLAIGEWDEADARQRRRAPRASPPTSRTCSSSSAPTSRSAAATSTPRGRTSKPRAPPLREDRGLATLRRLRRRARPVGAPLDGRRRGRARRSGPGAPARGRPDPRLALRQGTARAGGAGGARPRPPGRRRRSATGSLARATLLAAARRAAAEAVGGHAERRRLARPGRGRVRARPRRRAARARGPTPRQTWERLERPPLAAYCRWRQAEALVAAGASRAEATVPLREAHAVAARIGAQPAAARARAARRSARGSISTPPDAGPPTRGRAWRRSSA